MSKHWPISFKFDISCKYLQPFFHFRQTLRIKASSHKKEIKIFHFLKKWPQLFWSNIVGLEYIRSPGVWHYRPFLKKKNFMKLENFIKWVRINILEWKKKEKNKELCYNLDHGCAKVTHCVPAQWRNFSHYCRPLRQYDMIWAQRSTDRRADGVHIQAIRMQGWST